MITGVEAAGLAFGLYPIVIDGIDFFISVIQEFNRARHYKRTLGKFKREIGVEKTKFENTWYLLVDRANTVSAGVLNVHSMEPSQQNLEMVLPYLPKRVEVSTIDVFVELHDILSDLKEELKKYTQDGVSIDYILARLCH